MTSKKLSVRERQEKISQNSKSKVKRKYGHFGLPATKHVCWGLLLDVLGLTKKSYSVFTKMQEECTDVVPDDILLRVAKQLTLKKHDAGEKEMLNLVGLLTTILDPVNNEGSGPKFCCESPRSDVPRSAKDNVNWGYSRDPFKWVNKTHRPDLALAAASYLARASVLFFRLPEDRRDFNAAKDALNDIFQASRLACRLYCVLPVSHFRKFHQDDYETEILKGIETTTDPWNSPYFIWTLLQLVEIQRGCIYRHLNHRREADRYLRHAHIRLEKFCKDGSFVSQISTELSEKNGGFSQFDINFVTPQMLRVFHERSKLLFHRGFIVESLSNIVICLAFLVRKSMLNLEVGDGSVDQNKLKSFVNKKLDLLKTMSSVLGYLNIVSKQSVWSKETITGLFGLSVEHQEESDLRIDVQNLASFLKNNEESEKILAAKILAHLGFIMIAVRRKSRPLVPSGNRGDRSLLKEERRADKWLMKFFTINIKLGLPEPPPLARYCLSIIRDGAKTDNGRKVVFEESIEKQFSQRLRETVGNKNFEDDFLDDQAFYMAVMDLVTQNVGNIVTIPRRLHGFLMRDGYKWRRTKGGLSKGKLAAQYSLDLPTRSALEVTSESEPEPTNKLVILRRWQSFNPKIPRPRGSQIRGGGCYLIWQGKGIVIDPGYDFIQNFYEEGFSLDDIDAVVVTHSHPDHDDDLSTLITLVKEWNDYHEKLGYPPDKLIKLDLFLNESAHMKFTTWLKASGAGIGRIVNLPLVVWNEDSLEPSERLRGDNVLINLRHEYSLDLEVIPAWHDDVIGKRSSVGLKFRLYFGDKRVGTVGYTGDTSCYQTYNGKPESIALSIEEQYKNCDVLVAHLGDIRVRDLFTAMEYGEDDNPLWRLLMDWFCNEDNVLEKSRTTPERIKQFYTFLTDLEIFEKKDLAKEIILDGNESVTVSQILSSYIQQNGRTNSFVLQISALREQLGLVSDSKIAAGGNLLRFVIAGIENDIAIRSSEPIPKATRKGKDQERKIWSIEDWHLAYAMIGYLCSKVMDTWTYRNHLGIRGIHRLYRSLAASNSVEYDRVFVVAELPEELSSYRHHVARLLNKSISENGRNNQELDHVGKVHAFTGDIGLHIRLGDSKALKKSSHVEPKIRCNYCNYNNELIFRGLDYHNPSKIVETPLSRLDSSMIYLCTEHDHYPEDKNRPADYLSRPNLRII